MGVGYAVCATTFEEGVDGMIVVVKPPFGEGTPCCVSVWGGDGGGDEGKEENGGLEEHGGYRRGERRGDGGPLSSYFIYPNSRLSVAVSNHVNMGVWPCPKME